jgi:hypothetical protein
VRRARAHRKGDHSLCRRESCPEAAEQALAAEVPERLPGGIELATQKFVDDLPYRSPDPRALLAQIAVQLGRRIDETGAMPAAVRELRVLLVQLTEVPNGPSGEVDVIRLRRMQRRLDGILAGAA